MASGQPRGAAPLETLASFMIVCVLIMITLPAVHSAREASRRMECANKIKELGRAVHGFSDANNRLPNQLNDEFWVKNFTRLDSDEPVDFVGAYSVQTLLLPFLEQGTLMDAISGYCRKASNQTSGAGRDKTIPIPWVGGRMADGAPNPFTTVVSAFLCPADNNAITYNPEAVFTGSCNYACNRGDCMIGDDWEENRNRRGVFFDGKIGGRMTLEDIVDGASNTLLFAEICSSISNEADVMYRSTVVGANIYGQPVASCLAQRGLDCKVNRVGDVWSIKGRSWGYGRAAYTNFHAAAPPNNPSCYDSRAGRDEGHACMCVSASSWHKGGVNVCMADGAVRFVSELVDCGDVNHVLGYPEWTGECHQWDGASTQGLWGALATPAGHEGIEL